MDLAEGNANGQNVPPRGSNAGSTSAADVGSHAEPFRWNAGGKCHEPSQDSRGRISYGGSYQAGGDRAETGENRENAPKAKVGDSASGRQPGGNATWERFKRSGRFRDYLLKATAPNDGKAFSGNVPESPRRRSPSKLRSKLYDLSDAYREHAVAPRVGKCGRVRMDSNVQISAADGRCQLAGLIRCRSKACPVCLARRRSEYAEQILRVAKYWREGWAGEPVEIPPKADGTERDPIVALQAHPSAGAYLATFTLRHGWSDDLEVTALGMRKAWGRFLGGRRWRKIRERYGFEYIVASEATHGKNGWHPHLHVLFFPTRPIPFGAMLPLADELSELWASMVVKHIGKQYEPAPDVGTDFKRTRGAGGEDYVSKAVGLELADPGTKRAKGGGRTPIQLLQSWANEQDDQALCLYQHYERTMSGYRDLTWSAGLRTYRAVAIAELEREREVANGERELIADVPGSVWDIFREKKRPHLRLLEAAEGGGLASVAELIRAELGSWAADKVLNLTESSLARPPPLNDSDGLQQSSQLGGELLAIECVDPF